MKKLLFAFIFCLLGGLTASAQGSPEVFVKSAADTSVNTDTLALDFSRIGSNVKSLQVTVLKLTGTASGKVYLQGTIDGEFVSYDSLTLTDKAVNTKIWSVTSTQYASYRAYYVSSGTQTSILRFSYVRRPDEN